MELSAIGYLRNRIRERLIKRERGILSVEIQELMQEERQRYQGYLKRISDGVIEVAPGLSPLGRGVKRETGRQLAVRP